MKHIHISDQAHDLLLECAIGEFVETGKRVPSGGWIIPLNPTIYERLAAFRFKDETWSDAILRLVARAQGKVS